MESNTVILLPLLVILLTGLLVSEFFTRMKLPFASAIIFIGALLGPYGLQHVNHNEVITFFGFLGSAFLMFMAGLETDIPALKKKQGNIAVLAALNGLLPFATGFTIVHFFGYPLITSLLMGTIFLSSSVAIVFSVMESVNVEKTTMQTILSTAIVEDVASLLIFAMILQNVVPQTALPLPLFIALLLVSIVLFRYMLPRLARIFIQETSFLPSLRKNAHEDRLRFTIVVLIAVLLYFSLLGVHPILAAFFVGLLLSQETMGKETYEKFHTLSYGLFVPVFFFIIGMELNFMALFEAPKQQIIIVSIALGLIGSKFISGYVGGLLVRMSQKDSFLFGFVTTTQLTTTLAVAYAAFSVGLLDQRLMASCIVLAVLTNVFVPLSLRFIQR